MKTEIEAKFLNVNHDDLRFKLRQVGAVPVQPLRLMCRRNFDLPNRARGKWARVRDEGNRITITYKQVDDRTALGTKEINVTVDSFDKACKLLEAIGMKATAYQETRRESWKLGEVEIELDEWPGLEPLVEIEAPSEEKLWETASLLEIDKHERLHGSADGHYALVYDITEQEVNHWPEITFTSVPEWLESKRK